MSANASEHSPKTRLEMSPERDFPETAKKSSYCIVSSPRSGSTLLARMLYKTGKAGDPIEYLNPKLRAYERDRIGAPSLELNSFLELMARRRTSPNGVFGVKADYFQLLAAFGLRKPDDQIVQWLRGFEQLIWIRRKDRIAQGISRAVAFRTRVWSSEESRQTNQDSGSLAIDPAFSLSCINEVASNDRGWEMLLQKHSLPFIEVWYEDLVADYEGESRRVLRYLDLLDQVGDIPPPPIEKQAGPESERLRRDLLAYLGL